MLLYSVAVDGEIPRAVDAREDDRRTTCCGVLADDVTTHPPSGGPRAILPQVAAKHRKPMRRNDIRNIAIIAHVDHGKTTLVDALIRQSGHFRESEVAQDCILDSNDLERERGITILAKNISLEYHGVKINIIDTPGHADFGGEVERVLKMADGAIILVDAFEGPKPQTRFVLTKAMEVGLKPLIVINKIDRPDCRPEDVLLETLHLLEDLGADDPISIPHIYASGRAGYASHDPEAREGNIYPLLDLVVETIPGPDVEVDRPFAMTATTLLWSEYVGRIAVGRVESGVISTGNRVVVMREDGRRDLSNVEAIELFDRLGRVKSPNGTAGDIVALIGLPDVQIGDTIALPEVTNPLPRIKVDEPTLSMVFTINSSPLAGKSGKFLTSRHLRDRLMRELQSNVALRVEETDQKECFRVSGRGLLHLSILIETMRREGYELSVGKPEVVRKEINGKWHEPFEHLDIEVPSESVGSVMEVVTARRGMLQEMAGGIGTHTHLEFTIPARGLIGLRTRLLNATRGEAVIHNRFEEYRLVEGTIPRRKNGVMISQVDGRATAYALWKLQERSEFFIGANSEVYAGMIVGENSRENDLVVNPIREKKLSNVRSSGADDAIILEPPRIMSLEVALEYIESDEYVEVTPAAIRLRKIYLSETERKRHGKVGV
ncbi:MAG: translational GTPase TypA [Planctomycetaceae bacterium]